MSERRQIMNRAVKRRRFQNAFDEAVTPPTPDYAPSAVNTESIAKPHFKFFNTFGPGVRNTKVAY
jgi:hypothetical protein